MADDKRQEDLFGSEEKGKKPGDSDLGNLPPLSDFDSGGFQSDSNLPPVGSLDSDADKKDSAGGLPPLSDLSVETPIPTGGNVKPAPAAFQFSESDFESPVFETPGAKPRKGRPGFQDPAADSDFSPETPELGPGPDSDMDTPMFDSAFGGARGGAAGGFTPAFDTPAPTQAMETPMFGAEQRAKAAPEAPGFDEGAFMPGGGFEPAGTPAPDFSPDTAAGAMAPVMPPVVEVEKKKRVAVGGPKGALITALAAVIALVVGVFVGPLLSTQPGLGFIPNPLTSVIADKEKDIERLNRQIREATPTKPGEPELTADQIDKLIAQKKELDQAIAGLTADQQTRKAELDKTTSDLAQVRSDLEAKNEEFVKTQDAFEDLQNQTAIVQARQVGLLAEVDRLNQLVGVQEEAQARSLSTKEALQSSADQLVIQIREGIPLTPEKYAWSARLAAAEALKAKVDAAKWVTPDLLDEYTALYKAELDIASSTAYFFAKLPVTNKIGETERKWAECVMKGNWAVYYRTLDGKNIGSYENIAEPGQTPQYAFRENLPETVKKQIDAEILALREPGFENKLRVLAEKQAVTEGNATSFQRAFDSL